MALAASCQACRWLGCFGLGDRDRTRPRPFGRGYQAEGTWAPRAPFWTASRRRPTPAILARCCRLPSGPITASTAPTERLLLSQANDVDDAHVRRVDQHDLILNHRVFQRP